MIDILVHLDDAERSAAVCGVAAALARRLDGRLSGFFAHAETVAPSLVARQPSDRFLAACARAETLFRTVAPDGPWWVPAHGEARHGLDEAVFCSRYADLVVIGQWLEESHVPEPMVERIIVGSGRPVLVVPHVGAPATLGERVVVAWNGSREAARAIHDALPLLRRAGSVILVSLGAPDPGALPPGPRMDMAAHLLAKGVPVERERLGRSEISAMDQLLSHICDLGADLLVMGAHGHRGPFARLRQSGTRHILRHMTVPVLMAH
jgi:nucleotide-binding universal stress UspA family protein